jgi:hypothetical protein
MILSRNKDGIWFGFPGQMRDQVADGLWALD